MSSTRSKYDSVAMILHWLGAALVIYMLFFGEDLMRVKNATTANGPSWHVSLGVAILVITILRLLWRVGHRVPPMPATMKPWEITLARLTHLLLYTLLILLPLSGWLAFPLQSAKYPILEQTQMFGLFRMWLAPDLGLPAKNIHGLLSNVMIGLLALHVLAALKHQFINRDGLLKRMLP